MKQRRNIQLEGLRGIAMLFVLCFHFFSVFPNKFSEPLQHNWFGIELWGYFGVGVFILISGYFILGEDRVNPILFTVKKILRLWPVYAVAITICFLLTRYIPLPGRTVSLSAYLFNLPFINGFIGVDYVDGSHWYLTTLIACTFVAAMISRVGMRKRWALLVIWAAFILILENVELENRVLDLFFGGLYKIFGGRYAAMFIAGMALRLIKENKNIVNTSALFVAHLINFLVFGWQREVVFLFATMIFCLANAQKINFLKVNIFVRLGMISYSVYVIHQNVGFWCLYQISKAIGKYTVGLSVVITILMIGIGTLLYYIVERPCNNLVKKMLDKKG